MFIIFREFSLFVNITYLHNIRDNTLNQAFLIYFFYTEKFTDSFFNFSANFQPKNEVGLCSMANLSTNVHENRYNSFWDMATNRQTNKQTNRGENIYLLTEVINETAAGVTRMYTHTIPMHYIL